MQIATSQAKAKPFISRVKRMFNEHIKLRDSEYTEKTGIYIANIATSHWQHISSHNDRLGQVGPIYPTRAALMEDHLEYLLQAGWLTKFEIEMPVPEFVTATNGNVTAYGWKMYDPITKFQTYSNSKKEAFEDFASHINTEYVGAVTVRPASQSINLF